jgi:transcription elongation factor SPT6
MNSNRGIKYYPDASFTPLQRYLVSLARKAQDPITEYAGLMNSDDDIKHLQLHPLQRLLPDEKLKKALEISFMNVVANW